MSAIGTKRTCRVALHMSAFGGKADITPTPQNEIVWRLAPKFNSFWPDPVVSYLPLVAGN